MTYLVGADDKPSLEELVHFGTKGMRWGVRHKPKPPTRAQRMHERVNGPERPRALSTKADQNNPSREDQLVGRVIGQAHQRAVQPHLDRFDANIPKHNQSSDPRVNELLSRTLQQARNSVEADAGRAFMQGLPTTFRQ